MQLNVGLCLACPYKFICLSMRYYLFT
uniref:Uncharacterized protein n=1 Tax=Rhizophora mucronata TaxID=61149 RepID=A0A2P2NMN6_RHIMU